MKIEIPRFIPPQMSKKRRRPNRWFGYEMAKRALSDDLTPREYDAACAAIAKGLGL